MATPEAIRVEGLAEFRRSLKALDASLPKMLRLAQNEAGELIRDKTLPWIPRRSGKTAASVKLRSTQTKAIVVGGGNRVPWYPWLDFGGRAGRNKSVERRRVPSGRYTWRTLGKHRDEVAQALDSSLRKVAREAGLEVTDGR